jgi:hypothetical protein
MLDTPSNDAKPAPARTFLRFFGLGNSGDRAGPPSKNRPPKEPEERKHQYAIWYFCGFSRLDVDPVFLGPIHTSQNHTLQPVPYLLLHWPNGVTDLSGVVTAFGSLRAAGKIRAWGVSNFKVSDMEDLFHIPHGDHHQSGSLQSRQPRY